ncbi:MAG: S24 family peptidase [Cyanobium sp.]
MPVLRLDDLLKAIPIPYRSAEAPDGLDLNSLLIAHPLSTFFRRVRGHRLHRWGVHDGDLLLVDRAIEPRPGQLLVVAHAGQFLLRPLEVEGSTWQLAALGPGEAPLPLDPVNPLDFGLFGVAAAVVHDLVRRRTLPQGRRPGPATGTDGRPGTQESPRTNTRAPRWSPFGSGHASNESSVAS